MGRLVFPGTPAWGGAFALPLAFRPAFGAEDRRESSWIWVRFVASGAERKLGSKAEAMPHNPVSKS
jgi:hypothetical protein